MSNKYFITAVLTVTLAASQALAQSAWTTGRNSVENYPSVEALTYDINTLCSRENAEAGRDAYGMTPNTSFIGSKMAEAELMPLIGKSYIQSFTTPGGKKGCNVVGMLEGFRRTGPKRYIVVGAHYDNLGIINGSFYPGADSNASGVAALLEIANSFRQQRTNFQLYSGNIVFVAFDRFMDGRAGSQALWDAMFNGDIIDPVSHTAITPNRVIAMVDLDQIGCTLVPVKKDVENYIIALGEKSLPESKKGVLSRCNDFYGCGLEISDTYYGSERFTKSFYALGDRRIFINEGIPTMFFTSGITDNNNRVSDTPETINAEVLRKRAILIFRFIEKLF